MDVDEHDLEVPVATCMDGNNQRLSGRRPGDIYGRCIPVLLDRVKLTTGRQGATRLVSEGIRCMVLVGQILPTDRHPDIIFILADKHIHEIAAIIILCHPNLIPINSDLITFAGGADIFRWPIKGVSDPQAHRLDCDGFNIAHHINHVWGDPTKVTQTIEFYIQPAADGRAASHEAGIALLQIKLPQVCLSRPEKAGSQGYIYRDFWKIESGCGCDGGCGGDGWC